jgi:two-component system response regulator RegA
MELAQRSVLLVDDDRTFLSTFAREFTRRRWRVSTAQNSDEATPRARADRPAVIVLDMMLGSESGLELIERLRHEAPGARIVVLTGSATIATAVDAIKRGADHYLEKPATVEQIIESIDHRIAAESESLAQSERAHIERVLHEAGGNVSEAARRLRMHRRTLQRKLRKTTPP